MGLYPVVYSGGSRNRFHVIFCFPLGGGGGGGGGCCYWHTQTDRADRGVYPVLTGTRRPLQRAVSSRGQPATDFIHRPQWVMSILARRLRPILPEGYYPGRGTFYSLCQCVLVSYCHRATLSSKLASRQERNHSLLHPVRRY